MKLNKVIKWMIIRFSIIVLTACSSKKGDEKNSIENTIQDNNNNLNLSTNQLNHQQIEELQSNNIVYFDFDKYNVTPEYEQILDQQAFFLRKNPFVNIIIEGHTDERGTSEYNIALGERRANVVKIYLQSKGINDKRISILSYGKEKPAVFGHNESIYSKNRRAVIIY
ncbi:MAG: peptidoglycan-associated lipoprotein Pal [Arsenophonus sp. ET-DL9-MAG3]